MPGLAEAFVRLRVSSAQLKADTEKGISEASAGPVPATAGKKAGQAYGSGMSGALKSLKGTIAVLGLAGLAIGVDKSVKAASEFQAQMEKIHTQAGGTQHDVASLTKSIMSMTDAQQGPQELAQAMFHLKSVGLDNVNAMKALKAASDLAAVGGANLEDTTNAVAGAWRSGVKGAQSFSEAAATVNSIVGAGNVKMQDLVAAIGTGILPSARAFGVSFKSVGAALALMTDEGIPAQQAATRLRMSLSLLGAPSKAAEVQLKSIGLTGLKLANDMRSPGGIVTAIGDLKSHLEASGKSASEQAQVLSHAFGGGRSSSAILTLINNYEVLRRKQDQVNAGISKFGQDVAAQKQTAEAQFHILSATVERLGISIGNVLLPVAVSFTKLLNTVAVPLLGKFAGVLTGAGKGSQVLRGALFGLAAAFTALKSIGLVSRLISGTTAAFGRLALVFRSMRGAAAAGTDVSTLAKGVGTLASKQNAAAGGAGLLGAAVGKLGVAGFGAATAYGALAIGLGAYIYSTRNSLTLTQQIDKEFDAERTRLGYNAGAYTKLANSISQQGHAAEQTRIAAGRLDSTVQANTDRIQAYTGQQNAAITAGKNLTANLNTLQSSFHLTRGQAIDLASAAGVSAKQLGASGDAGRKALAKIGAYGLANEKAKAPVQGLNTDLQVTANHALSATDRIKGLTDALNKMLDPLTSNSNNLVTFYGDLSTAEKTLKKSGGAMGYFTQKQRDSRSAFNTVLGDLETLITNTNQSSKQLDHNRDLVKQEIPALYAMAGSNKSARQEVAALAQAVRSQTGDIGAGHANRADINSQTRQAGGLAVTAKGDITRLSTAIRHIPPAEAFKLTMTGSGSYTIHGPGANFIGPAVGRGGVGSRPGSAQGSATGGKITGPGGPTADRAGLFALSNTEWVIQSKSSQKYGDKAMASVNAGTAQIIVPGLAGGGLAQTGNRSVLSGQYAVNMANTFKTDLSKNLASQMRSAIKSDERMMTAAGGIGGGVRRWAGLVSAVLKMLNLPASYLGPWLSQMTTESGGNPIAINRTDSNAAAGDPSRGLLQTIMSTFLAYAGPFRSLGIYNPLANIYAAINYWNHAYHGDIGVIGHGHGYAGGTRSAAPGWAMVGERGPEPVYFNGGEQVESNMTLRRWMRDNSPGGGAARIEHTGPLVEFSGDVHMEDKTGAVLVGQQVSLAVTRTAFGR